MKKYFSIIAMVLIAALLVVSCAQESVNYNELLRVSVAATGMNGKILSYTGSEASTYKYTLEPLAMLGENAYGAVSTETAISDANFKTTGQFDLGYVSQGLWKLTIIGYDNSEVAVCKGVSEIYVKAGSIAFTVDLKPEGTTNGTIHLGTSSAAISMPALDKAGAAYKLYYTVTPTSGTETAAKSAAILKASTEGAETVGTETWVKGVKFTATDVSVKPGSYLVKIDIIPQADAAVTSSNSIGSIIGTVVVAAGGEATVSGRMSPYQFLDLDKVTVSGISITGTLTTTTATAEVNQLAKNTSVALTWTTTAGVPTSVTFYQNGSEIETVNANSGDKWSVNQATGVVTATSSYQISTPGYYYFSAVAVDANTQGGDVLDYVVICKEN